MGINQIIGNLVDQSARISGYFNDFVRHSRLENGITLISQRRFQDQKLRFSLLIGVGSFEDTQELQGISHFLEHVIIPKGIFDDFIERGGSISAYTNAERIIISGNVDNTPDNLEFLIGSIDKIISSYIDETSFEKEKRRILNEINIYNDQANVVHVDMLNRLYEEGRSVANILGHQQIIREMTVQQVRDFKDKWFSAGNIYLSFSNIPSHQALHNKVQLKMGHISNIEVPDPYRAVFEPKDVREMHEAVNQLYVGIHFPLEPTDTKGIKILRIADIIINQMMMTRLIENDGLVYSANASVYSDYKRPGILSLTVNILPEDGDKLVLPMAEILASAAYKTSDQKMEIAKKVMLDSIQSDKKLIPFIPHGVDHMVQSFYAKGRSTPLIEEEKEYASITSDEVRAMLQKIIAGEPGMTAYGDSRKLQSLDFFKSALRQKQAEYMQNNDGQLTLNEISPN